MKRFLCNHGVLVLDRLGHQITMQLSWQTGAQPISAPFSFICTEQLGHLSDVTHQVINRKSYICFEGGPRCQHTLVLCALTEEAGKELKQVTNSAYQVLLQAFRDQTVLQGAGVWQRHLADYVTDWARQHSVELTERFGCSRTDVLNIVECFASSLQGVAQLIQPEKLQQPGVILLEQSEILDRASSCVSALNTAVAITQSLLKLQFHTVAS